MVRCGIIMVINKKGIVYDKEVLGNVIQQQNYQQQQLNLQRQNMMMQNMPKWSDVAPKQYNVNVNHNIRYNGF